MVDRGLAAALGLLKTLRPAIEAEDRASQVDIVRRLVAMRAPMGGQWRQLALLAAANGELALARKAIDRLVDALGSGPAALYQRASLLFEIGAVEDAEQVLRALPANVPDPIANAYSRGIAALNLGRPAEARPSLERVVRARPQAGSAWLALSMTVDFAVEPEFADLFVKAERELASAAPAEQAPYFYALGKAHAELGDRERAFAAYARGAKAMAGLVTYDRARDCAQAAEAIDGYSGSAIAALSARQTQPTARTIFATGLPRSGTTLVERILTSHSAVAAGAEIESLALLAREVGGRSCAALARYVEAGASGRAAALWHHWLDERFPGGGRMVDKSVDASRHLGIAAAILPEAPLIWVTRDPLDRAWSCFRTNFLGGAIAWSYDLADIAFHFRLEDDLLTRWQALLGQRLLVVPYEDLVADTEPWIARILAHCGLANEPQAFEPHRNHAPVATASMMQVRRPINRDAVGSAEPYREYLRPFIEAYYG